MSQAELDALTKAGAGAAVAWNSVSGFTGAPANGATGYSRQVNGDGSVTLTAFLVNGSTVTATIPAAAP
jgi:hypothetical protein